MSPSMMNVTLVHIQCPHHEGSFRRIVLILFYPFFRLLTTEGFLNHSEGFYVEGFYVNNPLASQIQYAPNQNHDFHLSSL